MAKRLIDTEMWKKPWYRKLKAQYKCFWNYLLSNCNHAGIWDADFDLATFQIGEIIRENVATELFRDQVLIFDHGRKWLVIGFIRFQYGETLNEKSPVHKKVIDTLKGIYHNGYTLLDTLSNTLSNRGKEKEEDKEEEKEEEKAIKGVQGENNFLIMPFESAEFANAWLAWREYKKTQYKFKYGSVQTEQIALKQLSDLAKGDELTAIRIIQQSIGNTWKGFFPLKDIEKNGKQAASYDDEIKRRFPNLHKRAV